MVTITTNISGVVEGLRDKLTALTNKEYIPRMVAFGIIDQVTQRVHERGEAADGGQIGTYSNGYLKLRERKYNRGTSSKVIVSLTRQLENDWSVIATDKGYGIGFLNSFNKDKAGWVEEIKDKKIFELTANEQKYVQDLAQELVTDALR